MSDFLTRHTMTNQQKEKIIYSLRDELFDREEIIFAYLHGSFLGEGDFADVDVALFLVQAKAPEKDIFSYEMEISTYLSRRIGFFADVRVLNYAPLGFQFNVTKGKLLFTKDEQLHQEFIEQVWLEYMDFNFLSRQILRDALC